MTVAAYPLGIDCYGMDLDTQSVVVEPAFFITFTNTYPLSKCHSSIRYSPTSHPFMERLIDNCVEEPFEENILIVCFSGTLKTWSESRPPSNTITTNIEFINHWQAILPCSLSITLKSNVLNLITIPGDHTVMAYFKLRSLHEFGFRHTQANATHSYLDGVNVEHVNVQAFDRHSTDS